MPDDADAAGTAAPTGAALRSMTGFGRGERQGSGLVARVEIRSVNGRHLKISARVPPALEGRLPQLEAVVRQRLDRGSVSLSVSLERSGAAAPSALDVAVLAEYGEQLRQAAHVLDLEDEPLLSALVRLPGVLRDRPEPDLSEEDLHVVAEALGAALDGLLAMRGAEGAAVAATLTGLLDEVAAAADRIETRVPTALAEHHERLRDRLAKLLEPGEGPPQELVAREIAVLAERSDVAEELARLRSHEAQARDAIAAGSPAGRRLEFLAQELLREANTIGSKTNDAEIGSAVVDLKLGLDRLKEQAANVE